MVIKICKFCEQKLEYKNVQSFGAHVVNCKLNPKRVVRHENISIKKTFLRKEYKFNCKKCDNEYVLLLKETDFIKKKFRKTCSSKCSNGHYHSNETIIKISKSLKGKKIPISKRYYRGITYIERECKICENKFLIEPWRMKSFCSKSCSRKNSSIKKMGDKNPMFGKAPIHHKYQGGYYFSNKINKNIRYRSSYELKALKILDNDISVVKYEYESIRIPYDNGKHNTIPDFIVTYANGIKKMIEVKCKALLKKFNNSIKIKAMKKYCKKNDIQFELWMEEELNIKKP